MAVAFMSVAFMTVAFMSVAFMSGIQEAGCLTRMRHLLSIFFGPLKLTACMCDYPFV